METKLTPIEMETAILYNQAESTASVYTHDPKLIKKLKRLSDKYPDKIRLEKEDSSGGVSYLVPKKCILVREPYSDERREAARERAVKGGYMPPRRE